MLPRQVAGSLASFYCSPSGHIPAPTSLPHSLVTPAMPLVSASAKQVELGYCFHHPPHPGKPQIPAEPLGIPSTLCRLNHPLASHPSSCWEWRWEVALTVSSVLLNPTRRYVVFPFWIWEINYLFCLWALVKVSRLVKFYLIPCYTCSLNKST